MEIQGEQSGFPCFASIRQDLLSKNLSVPVGEGYYGDKEPLPYRWINETRDYEGELQVYYNNEWQEAMSVDFDFN